MIFARRPLTPKARRFLAAGNLCLVFGLTLPYFGNALGDHHPALFDFLRGLSLGLAITFIFCAFRLGRRCTEDRV